MTVQEPEANKFGAALKRFRHARRMSQLDLALACDVSARHLSFLESGRARPSREMVMHLGAGLMLPLSARNSLLQTAGFSPCFPASPLDCDELGPFRAILDDMLSRHAPNPALLIDRHWNVHEANAAGRLLLAALQDSDAEVNIVRLLTAGEKAAKSIVNLPEVLRETHARMELELLASGGDTVCAELLALLDRAIAQHPQSQTRTRRPVVPIVFNSPAGPLRFLTAMAHFGTSEDVTVRDLRLELFFPADAETRAVLARF